MATNKSGRQRPLWLGIGVGLLMPTLWVNLAGPGAGEPVELTAPAAGQVAAGAHPPPPPLLSTREVQAGLAVRLPRMRQRQAARAARRSAEQQALSAPQRARMLGRQPPPRDPAPIPAELQIGLEQ